MENDNSVTLEMGSKNLPQSVQNLYIFLSASKNKSIRLKETDLRENITFDEKSPLRDFLKNAKEAINEYTDLQFEYKMIPDEETENVLIDIKIL